MGCFYSVFMIHLALFLFLHLFLFPTHFHTQTSQVFFVCFCTHCVTALSANRYHTVFYENGKKWYYSSNFYGFYVFSSGSPVQAQALMDQRPVGPSPQFTPSLTQPLYQFYQRLLSLVPWGRCSKVMQSGLLHWCAQVRVCS